MFKCVCQSYNMAAMYVTGFTVLFWLCSLHCSVALICNVCPNNWLRYGNSCYLFADSNAYPWKEAMHYCALHNSHLAIVETATENTILRQQALRLFKNSHDRGHVQFWLNGTDKDKEGSWLWNGRNLSVTGNHWTPGHPNGSHGGVMDCLAMSGSHAFHWIDSKCSTNSYPLCEIESPLVPNTISDLIG